MAQTAKRLANLTADLGLAKEPPEGLPGWPGKLPEQIAKEPLRRQLPAAKPGLRPTFIHLPRPSVRGIRPYCCAQLDTVRFYIALTDPTANIELGSSVSMHPP